MELALQFSNFYVVKNLVFSNYLLNLVPNEPKKYSVNIPIVQKLECIHSTYNLENKVYSLIF
jgi:hypothetical protein